ncbi:hypothetical protein H4W80_010574 [Nonomuraea angiospora]|uniref:Uncharacterized protein n=1 Tax=Nonomuraea angiospora TaxID=46172 RepID=A0ABR9MJ02_9ACTN|nr:hypothetical protein [Nonomuraea angiospora]
MTEGEDLRMHRADDVPADDAAAAAAAAGSSGGSG